MDSKKGKKKHSLVAKKIEKNLDITLKEGAINSFSDGLGYSYISPFALAMNASSSQVGILQGIISLVPSISQLRAPKVLDRFSSKKIMTTGTLSQIFIWILIIFCGVGFYFELDGMVYLLMIFSGLLYFFHGIIQPSWFAWMGQIVPENIRGRFFSKRNVVVGIFGIISMVVGAIILDRFRLIAGSKNIVFYTLLGFTCIFILTMVAKYLSYIYLKKIYQPKIKLTKKDYFSFTQFIRRAPKTPFGKYTIFRSFFSVAIGVSAPFFTVYLLKDLGFSYLWFIVITAAGVFFQLIFLPLLGKLSDSYGNIQLTKISTGFMFIIPLLWYISSFIQDSLMIKLYLLIVPSIVTGFAWAGYNLATNNYVYDSVKQQKRGYGASYMNFLVGISLFIGAIIGSALAKITFMDPILFIFLVSAGARLLVFLLGIKHLKEVRPVKKFSSRFLIKEFRPIHELAKDASYIGRFISNDKV